MAHLRNGTDVEDPRFDRLYELDWRSLDYAVGSQLLTVPTYRPRSYTWSINEWLDQGPDGACVGFAFAHELIARPQMVNGVDYDYAKNAIYLQAQRIDPWEGGAYPGADPFYEGTSVLAGAKICRQNGFYDSYWWALNTEELARALAYFGPCVLGINWYEGMYNPDPAGYLHPIGRWVGGHAILVKAIKIKYKSIVSWFTRRWSDVDWDRSYVTIHNSWGKSWGEDGTAKITLRDLDLLIQQDGEACFPRRTEKRSA